MENIRSTLISKKSCDDDGGIYIYLIEDIKLGFKGEF